MGRGVDTEVTPTFEGPGLHSWKPPTLVCQSPAPKPLHRTSHLRAQAQLFSLELGPSDPNTHMESLLPPPSLPSGHSLTFNALSSFCFFTCFPCHGGLFLSFPLINTDLLFKVQIKTHLLGEAFLGRHANNGPFLCASAALVSPGRTSLG